MTGISSQFSIFGDVWQCESVPKNHRIKLIVSLVSLPILANELLDSQNLIFQRLDSSLTT